MRPGRYRWTEHSAATTARQVLRPDLAPLLLPQPEQGLLVLAHYDPGVGAADEVASNVVSCGRT
jgi:hypothetical protein